MVLFWAFRKIFKTVPKTKLMPKTEKKPYKFPIFFHISPWKCYFLTLTFFLLVLTWNHPSTTRKDIASLRHTAEIYMKAKHVKKKMHATPKSASTDTPKLVETLSGENLANFEKIVPTSTRRLTQIHLWKKLKRNTMRK